MTTENTPHVEADEGDERIDVLVGCDEGGDLGGRRGSGNRCHGTAPEIS